MKVKELIRQLQELDGEREIHIFYDELIEDIDRIIDVEQARIMHGGNVQDFIDWFPEKRNDYLIY